jgi:hypothetical protein
VDKSEHEKEGRRELAFEVRPALSEFESGEKVPRMGAFTDEDWHKILTLAKGHGFDRAGDYEEMLFPGEGESRELPLVASQELAIALSELLREETSPEGEIEGQAWVYDPERDWEREPVIRVGPPERPELHVGWTQVRRLGNLAESGHITIARVDEPAS